MKIETIQKFEFRIKLLSEMKDDYLYLLQKAKGIKDIDMSSRVEYYKNSIHVLDCIIKSYIRKVEKQNGK